MKNIISIGGWAGGCASSEDFIKNADLMWKQSVWSSAISAKLASKHLKEEGNTFDMYGIAILNTTRSAF